MFNDSRFYYGLGIFIIAAAFVVFAWSFERKKPRTREIVILAVMISFGVMGRIIFYMTPQVKPCAAIIIITGIALGKQAGFVTGAMTAFVSNFFMGQGPWTPWQMIAFGIIGYVFGAAYFKKIYDGKIIQRKKIEICVLGCLATIIIYGVIMDSATVFIYTKELSIGAFAAAYTAGLIMNVIHGLSTFIFLWFMLIPMIKKLKRVNLKYGMYNFLAKNKYD